MKGLEDPDDAVASAALAYLLGNEPVAALPSIVEALRRRPQLIRVAASRVLEIAKDAGRHACPALEAALGDSAVELRLFAARVLSNIDHRRAAASLATVSQDADPRVREWGVLGLSRLEEEWAAARVAHHAASDPHPAVRRLAAQRRTTSVDGGTDVGAMPGAALPREGWRAALEAAHPFVRERAADLLGDARDVGAATALRARLADGSPAVRAAAARALASLPDAGSVAAILASHDDDAFWGAHPGSLRGDLAWAAAVLGDAGVLARLVAIEQDRIPIGPDDFDSLGSALARLVDRLGNDALDPLLRLLAERGRPARLAATLLGRIPDARAQAGLADAVDDDDVEVASDAARALAVFAGPELLPRLLARAAVVQFDEGPYHGTVGVESPERIAHGLDPCLSSLMERHAAELADEDLRRALTLPTFPWERRGCEIVQRPGFDWTLRAARRELDRREQGRGIQRPLELGRLISAFRDRGGAPAVRVLGCPLA